MGYAEHPGPIPLDFCTSIHQQYHYIFLTFNNHLTHLDKVFRAITQVNIMLTPAKCHFAFQSLLLLGQKVSRLGLSMHKEKVSAIMQLDIPRNVSELQSFLGMMVYFSRYIPFYAWKAHHFFQLLKKGTK